MGVRTDRRWDLTADRRTVWAALCRVEDYPTWWPWLRQFDGRRLADGERWHCVVKPQLPYSVAFELELVSVVPEQLAVAHLDGDLSGWARLALAGDGNRCALHLTSQIDAAAGPARMADRWVPRLAVAGHDWVLARGMRQFRRAALANGD